MLLYRRSKGNATRKKEVFEMKYKVIMGDNKENRRIEMCIEAKSVFDAIDIAADKIDNPEETELVEAYPLD